MLNFDNISEKLLDNDNFKDFVDKKCRKSGFWKKLYGMFFTNENVDCNLLKLIPYNPSNNSKNMFILISGFLSQNDDAVQSWEDTCKLLDKLGQVWIFKWPSKSYEDLLKKGAGTIFLPVVKLTGHIFSLLKGKEMKTLFSEATMGAKFCGEFLARVIDSNEIFVDSKVTLVGFSLGTHVIKSCLKELFARNKLKQKLGDIILMGGATVLENEVKWGNLFKQLVSGRKINVWSPEDRVLSFLYKFSMGRQAIGSAEQDNFENIKVDYGHLEYRDNFDKILNNIYN